MSKILLYYSLTGNGDAVAEMLKDKMSIRKIETNDPLPKNFGLKIMVGGFKALISYKDKLINFNNDIKDYDEIYIGSPIWCDRLCSPINSLLESIDLSNKRITFILYSGSGKIEHAIKKISKNYPNSRIILLKEPKNNIEGNKELLLKELE